MVINPSYNYCDNYVRFNRGGVYTCKKYYT